MAGKKSKPNETNTPAAGRNGTKEKDNDKNTKSTDTKVSNVNGSTSKIKSSSSPASLASSGFVIVVAFLAGIMTPPSLHIVRRESPAAVSSSSSPDQFTTLFRHTPCTASNLANYLHSSPVPGLHLVCIDPINLDANGKRILKSMPLEGDDQQQQQQRRLEHNNSIRLTFYKGSHSAPIRRRATVSASNLSAGVDTIAWKKLKVTLVKELGLIPEGPTQRPWAIFTPTGKRIVGANDVIKSDTGSDNKQILHDLVSSGMVIVANGGVWMWPGVSEGFQRTVEVSTSSKDSSDSRNVTIETLSLHPLVLSIKGFLSDEECDHIAEVARPTMQYSGVSLKDVDVGKAASEWRTSQSTFVPSNGDPILVEIEKRTASLTRVPRSHQEHVQVLRYGPKEKYDAHHDYFDPDAYRADESTIRLIENGKRNRYATVFWYLTDVDEGGETVFPRYGGAELTSDYADCSKGLKVKPQRGKVIIFYSLDAAGHMDELSLHGACPVGADGVKWAANKWVWNAPMGFVPDD